MTVTAVMMFLEGEPVLKTLRPTYAKCWHDFEVETKTTRKKLIDVGYYSKHVFIEYNEMD